MKTTPSWVACLACLSACGPSADKVPANDTGKPTATAAQRGVSAAPVTPPVNIMDYYNRMVDIPRYGGVSKTANGWQCLDDFDNPSSMPCVVDIPNGFISVEVDAGDGRIIQQIALFKKANGEVIIAVNTWRREAEERYINRDFTPPTFYAYRDGAFTTITKDVMPDAVTGDAFAAAPGTADSVEIFYDLPRHGTDITVSVNLRFADYCKKPESERGAMNPDLLESVNRRCKTYNGLVRKSVALRFDKLTGRFKLPK